MASILRQINRPDVNLQPQQPDRKQPRESHHARSDHALTALLMLPTHLQQRNKMLRLHQQTSQRQRKQRQHEPFVRREMPDQQEQDAEACEQREQIPRASPHQPDHARNHRDPDNLRKNLLEERPAEFRQNHAA